MAWHVYEFEKNASSSSGMFSMSEWKERLAADAGEYAASRVDMELADAVGAAREAGWRGEVQGEPRIFVCRTKRSSSSDSSGPARRPIGPTTSKNNKQWNQTPAGNPFAPVGLVVERN